MKTVLFIFLSIIFFSCSNEKTLRIKTLKENFVINVKSFSSYRKGDKVIIRKRSTTKTWILDENPIFFRDTFIIDTITNINNKKFGISISQKVGIIEEILE